MFVTSEKYPGRAWKSCGDLESGLATLVLVTDRDQSPLSSLGCDVRGEVLCPPGCGHLPAPEQTMPACLAQQVKTLLWRLCHGVGMWFGVKDSAVFYRGVMQGPARGGRGRLQGTYSMCRNTLLSTSLCVEGLFSKGLQQFLISGGMYSLFSALPFDMH